MNAVYVALAVLLTATSCFAQGQVVFANKVGTTVDAPAFLFGGTDGPGPNYSAQLFLQGAGGSLTALTPISTFRPRGTSGNGLTADRYWETKLVDVPVSPGSDATFVVRAWLTSLGSFDAAKSYSILNWGQSDPFVVSVGGGTLPPANLTTLRSFNVGFWPEPSPIAIRVLGAAVFLLFRRRPGNGKNLR